MSNKVTVFDYQRSFKFYFYNYFDSDLLLSEPEILSVLEDVEPLDFPLSTLSDPRSITPEELEQRRKDYLKGSKFRSKRAVERLVKLNTWTHFVTFTFDPSLDSDPDPFQKNFRLLKKGLKKIDHLLQDGVIDRYVLVPELQKSGLLHFHGFINILPDSFHFMSDSGYVKIYGLEKVRKLSTWKQKFSSRPCQTVFNFVKWSFGHSVCYQIDQANNDYLLKYVLKYIIKDLSACYDSQRPRRYFAGGKSLIRNLSRFNDNVSFSPQLDELYKSLKPFEIPNTGKQIRYFEIQKSDIDSLPSELINMLKKGGYINGDSRL